MNLEQTITDLEKQATQYTEAANSLRALLQQGKTSQPVGRHGNSAKVASKKAPARSKKQGRKKGAVSDETRAKISQALRASHAARKAQTA